MMTPAIAKRVHDLRFRHVSYDRIIKIIAPEGEIKRSSMMHYYYKWKRDNGINNWDSVDELAFNPSAQ